MRRHRDYFGLTRAELRLGDNVTDAEFWRIYGREMAEADSVTDIERAGFREAQETLGLGSYPFSSPGEETCGNSVVEEE